MSGYVESLIVECKYVCVWNMLLIICFWEEGLKGVGPAESCSEVFRLKTQTVMLINKVINNVNASTRWVNVVCARPCPTVWQHDRGFYNLILYRRTKCGNYLTQKKKSKTNNHLKTHRPTVYVAALTKVGGVKQNVRSSTGMLNTQGTPQGSYRTVQTKYNL